MEDRCAVEQNEYRDSEADQSASSAKVRDEEGLLFGVSLGKPGNELARGKAGLEMEGTYAGDVWLRIGARRGFRHVGADDDVEAGESVGEVWLARGRLAVRRQAGLLSGGVWVSIVGA